MKNVLVTGGTGFIGVNLIKRLIENDIKVYALIRPNSTLGTRRLDKMHGIKYLKSTPKELINNKALPQFDVCFNLAAYGVEYEQQNIQEMIEGNIKFLIDIIDFVHENGTNLLIHTGSCFEYGINEGQILSEESKLEPQSLYSSTKMSGTIIGNIYAKSKKVSMITVRPFGVYGPGEASFRLLPQLIESAVNGRELYMTPGEQVRDYLYIDDLIEAYMNFACSKNIDLYNIYNVCSSKPITIKEFVKIFCGIYKCEKHLFKFGEIPYRDREIMHLVGDNSKIKKTINWNAKISIEEGISLSIKHYKKYKAIKDLL